MDPVLPDEAVELAEAAGRAFAALGGVDVARRAEADPTVRRTEVAPVLAALGVDDLDPRRDPVSLAAAAALCEAAGRVALPHPLAADLVRDDDGRPTAAVPADVARVDHADLIDGWRVGTLDGASGGIARAAGRGLGTRLGPFVGDLTMEGDGRPPLVDLLLHQVLVAWTVLGTLDRAVALTVEHVSSRIQFGKPIAAFQAVQFQLADAAVAVAGLRELAGFTLWRLDQAGERARADVLALRLHALETARTVLRTGQQLHGAAGVCDEYDVSVLARMVQPALRLPAGVDRTAADLAGAIAADGFVGLFDHGGVAIGAGR
ncbi:MAG: acyl-CoA dehydrogenase family protein [Acidimicrobiales bacterium]